MHKQATSSNILDIFIYKKPIKSLLTLKNSKELIRQYHCGYYHLSKALRAIFVIKKKSTKANDFSKAFAWLKGSHLAPCFSLRYSYSFEMDLDRSSGFPSVTCINNDQQIQPILSLCLKVSCIGGSIQFEDRPRYFLLA